MSLIEQELKTVHSALDRAALVLRGMSMDPRIPLETRQVMQMHIKDLEAAALIVLNALQSD